jgi:lysophospholipase L1-like esterase
MGDSITAGAGASSTSKEYPQLLQVNDSGAWPGFDDLDLETSFPGIVDVIDVSVPGATLSSLENQQIPELESLLSFPVSGQTIIVMTIGGNDAQMALIPFADADAIMNEALKDFESITDWFLDPAHFADGAYLYASNLYEPSDGTGQSQCFFGFDYGDRISSLEELNLGLYDMGMDKGFAVVDSWRHFSGHGFNASDSSVYGYDEADPTNWFASDCIHPNDQGHHEFRRLFHAAIEGHGLPIE